jgi:hypothetical protein
MESPAVPSASLDGSSKREGEGSATMRLMIFFMTSSFPTDPLAAKPIVAPRARNARLTFPILTLEAEPRNGEGGDESHGGRD